MFFHKKENNDKVFLDISGDTIRLDHLKNGQTLHYVDKFYTVKQVRYLVGIRTLDKNNFENLTKFFSNLFKSYGIKKDTEINLVYSHISDNAKSNLEKLFTLLGYKIGLMLTTEEAQAYNLMKSGNVSNGDIFTMLSTNLYNLSISKIDVVDNNPIVKMAFYDDSFNKMTQITDFQTILQSKYFDNQFRYDTSQFASILEYDTYKKQIQNEATFDSEDFYKVDKLYRYMIAGKCEYENSTITSLMFIQQYRTKLNTVNVNIHKYIDQVYKNENIVPMYICGYKTIVNTQMLKDIKISKTPICISYGPDENDLLCGLIYACNIAQK